VNPGADTLGELLVKDSIDALNKAIREAGLAPGDILAILPVPRITPAIGDYEAKLRVLYRTNGHN
jgi:hypothetical protein